MGECKRRMQGKDKISQISFFAGSQDVVVKSTPSFRQILSEELGVYPPAP